jgi:aminoglycoside phosphotransferase family enzyme
VFIEIATSIGKNMIIGVIYRPPNGNIDLFETKFNQLLSKIDKENKICYLMGDFNIDLLKSESCDYTNNFLDQQESHDIQQHLLIIFLPMILTP